MNTKRTRLILLAIIGTGFAASSAMAAITPTTDDFSSDPTASWLDVGTTATVILHDPTSAKDWYDGDDLTYITNYTAGMDITGDGVLNDGGLRLNTQNAIIGDEAMGLDIAGTMESGEQITFSGGLYNDNTSGTTLRAQLWNKTDDRLLAETADTSVKNYNNIAYSPVDFSVNYTALAIDDGDTLQIRFLDQCNNTVRDIYVDNISVTSVPPLTPVLHAYEGFINGGIGDKTMETPLSGSGFTLMTNSNFRFVTATGLSYVDGSGNTLVSCGNSSEINPSASGTQNLQLSFPEISSGKVYVSFILDVHSVTTWGVTLGLQDSQVDGSLSTSPNSTLEAGIRSTSNANAGWGLYNPNGLDNRINTGPLGLNFIVMEVDIDNDSVVAWINPTDLLNVPGTSTILTDGGDTYTVGPVSSFLFSLAGDEAGTFDEIRIGNTLDTVVPTYTPLDYTAWAAFYGLTGSDTNSTANPDGDTLINLHEYALGGNPTNSADIGYEPESMVADADDATWLYYTYAKRCDAHVVGLDYYLQTTTNLVDGVWTNGGYKVTGVGIDAYGTGFNAITNRVSTETKSEQFIKLNIEEL